MPMEVLRKMSKETEHLPRLWTDTLRQMANKRIVKRSPETNQQ